MNNSKYEYGVEYETSQCKPNLPDDVAVEVGGGNGRIVRFLVGDVSWGVTTSFRIVDERYKPMGANFTNCSVVHGLDGVKNNWHERGELPPELEKCMITIGRDPEEKGCVIWYYGDMCWLDFGTRQPVRMIEECKFRAIPTERDKAISECVKILREADESQAADLALDDDNLAVLAAAMVDNGYRKVKQQTEDEFFEAAQRVCINWCENDIRKLYRANCRFVEDLS